MSKKSRFDFLKKRTDDNNAENSDNQDAESSITQQSDISRTQKSDDSKLQRTENTKTVGRPKGKRSNPEYTQVTSYIRKETYKQVRRELLDNEREFSGLIQELLEEWLQSRK